MNIIADATPFTVASSRAVQKDDDTNIRWWQRLLFALFVTEALLLAAFGWIDGEITDDTATYQVPLTWPGAFAEMRHPLYAVFLAWLDPIESHLRTIAVLQMAFQFFACFMLFRETHRYGLSAAASFALAVSALFSQSFLLYGRQALPEVPAMSAMIISVAATFRWSSNEQSAAAPCVVALFAAIASFLRPIYLAAIPILPMMTLVFLRLSGGRAVAPRTFGLAVALLVPFLAQSTIRAVTVGDFNVVSFSGFSMAGMAGLMIEPKHLPLYPEHLRPIATDVLTGRTQAELAGTVYATPVNSQGENSFVSAALCYFDVYARSIDKVTWGVVGGMRGENESWVAFNKRMQQFSIATLKIVPDRWVAWIVGGSSRFVGRSLITNVPFVLFTIAFLAVGAIRIFGPDSPGNHLSMKDWIAVAVVAAGWAIMTISVAIIAYFPATRYIDTASVFIPAIPLLAFITLAAWGRLR